MRYTLDVCERVIKSHRVTIDTDRDVDSICEEIERHALGINDIWDITYFDGVTVVKMDEDEDGESEFEVESVEEAEGREE